MVEACYQLSSRKVDAQSMINWTVVGLLSRQYLRAPTLDHCSLSPRSSSSVYSVIPSRAGRLATADTRVAAEFVTTAKAECSFGVELVGYWVMFSDRGGREQVAVEGGDARFSTLGQFTCKGKHWDQDLYKVFSVFTNGWYASAASCRQALIR